MRPPVQHTFDSIWGHEAARRMVPRLLASGRLPHALLLTGPDAIGKRSLAFAMAKAILSAGLPAASASVNAPAPSPARRRVNDDGDDDMLEDLFGDSEEQDLFGEVEDEAPPPEPPSKPEKQASAPPERPSSPPVSSSVREPIKPAARTFAPVRAEFRGYDQRICRLVEAAYPIESGKDVRPGHPDLTIIEPMGGRRGIVVDQMRALQDIANVAPIEGKFRVVLLFGADTITQEGGNSALKLLEEPPRYLVMILVADRLHGVLPTIRSRCSVVPMTPLDRETLVEKLAEEEKLDRDLAKVAAALSEGRPGVALAAIAADLLRRRHEVFEARLQLDRFGRPAVAGAAARIQKAGKLDETLWMLLSFARDRLVRAAAPDNPELLVHGDAMELLDQAPAPPESLDAEADRLVEAYNWLAHPFLPNQRAALQLGLWPDAD